ncbi:MAG: Putative ATPase [uncultured Aureispira sp.]|uniref:ATPase n=1 Tax=uncultured Aureispira sp. TaxID=1331704 RepID=A0A6S6UG30_9BACT|nr:MAG: Putative ATPase [uncultured Aureispira sp.]
MIKEIRIKNYKSVNKLKLDLGRVNVFIGANGCGKSNLLEAIGLGAMAFGGHGLPNEFLISRGIRVTEPQFMRSAFEKDTQNKNVELSFTYNNAIEWGVDLSHDGAPFSEWDTKPKEKLSNLIIKAIEENKVTPNFDIDLIMREKYSIVKHVEKFSIFSPENEKLREFASKSTTALGIHGSGLFYLLSVSTEEEIAEIKQNLKLIDWFDDFEMMGNEQTGEKKINIKDRYIANQEFPFDQRNANEGFLFLLFYLSLFISKYTPPFFAIDNIDNALNPKLCTALARRLTKLSQKHDKQVLITTHNPAVLDGLDLNDEEQRLFIVYRNIEGHTKVQRVNKKPRIEGEESVKLSEAFLRGYLGGLNKV